MQAKSCLNCGVALAPEQMFCSNCGQGASTKRLTIHQLGHDFLKLFLNTDKGIPRLFKGLALNPGKVAAEYAEGKRKKYFNPFTYTAICIGFMLLINNWIKPYDNAQTPSQEVLARIPDTSTKELYLKTVERVAVLQKFTNKHLNTITVLTAPYFAFFLGLFFAGRKRNFAETTVAYVLFSAFSTLACTLIFSPFLAYFRDSPSYSLILYSSISIETLYIAWGLKGFFNYRTAGGYIKVLAVLLLAGFIGLAFLILIYYFYVYHGGSSAVLKYL